ncbi:MAG: aminotransferase class III-fold pyridoxal phosphate-dependent enzyme [Gemmatimonadaceae bacterium]|nr:aminotransferase class III-fold pyridoxal phosphate-dependent enzyme [Gemmatimonadaceae bacterium]
MVFRKLFGASTPAPSPAAADSPASDAESQSPASEDAGQDADFEDAERFGDAEEMDRPDWGARAAAVLPTGASTGSKRPSALHGEGGEGPLHFVRASGCHVTDTDGQTFVDCTMALGAVALGYAEKRVLAAAVDAASRGNVAALSPVEEVEVAERLCDLVPCAEQVLFMKTGAEAVSAAVRLARTYTGRDVVIASGYFGWHDWASDAEGVPAAVRGDVVRIPFDDIPALEAAVARAGARLAAIVLEPVVERMPSAAWVQRARACCDAAGSILIVDEIKTGFRLRPAGYQELSGITPDLATFGKAMSNGFPLSAVLGQRDVMQAMRRTWISSTLASDSVALAAAGAVLDWHVEADVCATLAETGAEIRSRVDAAREASRCSGVRIAGEDPMWLMKWDDPADESLFISAALHAGALFKRGAYNYAAIAHDAAAIDVIERAASEGFIAVRDSAARRG